MIKYLVTRNNSIILFDVVTLPLDFITPYNRVHVIPLLSALEMFTAAIHITIQTYLYFGHL